MFENYRLLVQEVGQLTHYGFLRHLIGSTAQNCFHFHVARISDRFDTEKKNGKLFGIIMVTMFTLG